MGDDKSSSWRSEESFVGNRGIVGRDGVRRRWRQLAHACYASEQKVHRSRNSWRSGASLDWHSMSGRATFLVRRFSSNDSPSATWRHCLKDRRSSQFLVLYSHANRIKLLTVPNSRSISSLNLQQSELPLLIAANSCNPSMRFSSFNLYSTSFNELPSWPKEAIVRFTRSY